MTLSEAMPQLNQIAFFNGLDLSHGKDYCQAVSIFKASLN